MTTNQTQYNTPAFFVNSTIISGVLTKGEADQALTPIYITNERGQYAIFIESINNYLMKQFDELQDQTWLTVEAAIKQFPNGHYLVAQSFNQNISTASGYVIRANEPKLVNERMVINFAISQSIGKDDENGVVIECAYWYKPDASQAIPSKIRKGSYLTVAGSLKTGEYEKDGAMVPTLGIDCRHISSPKTSSNGIMPTGTPAVPKPLGKPPVIAKPSTTPSPVPAGAFGDDIDF